MILTHKSDYGLRAVLELANLHDSELLSARRIAQQQGLPVAFVKKLMQILCRAGLVTATVGQQGGYMLARSPEKISICELLQALEGNLSPVSCLTPDHDCKLTDGCSARRVWSQIDHKIQEILKLISLKDALSFTGKKQGDRYSL